MKNEIHQFSIILRVKQGLEFQRVRAFPKYGFDVQTMWTAYKFCSNEFAET